MKKFTLTQDKDGKQYFHSPAPFSCQSGQSLPALTLAFETYGELNTERNNVILVHHSLSMSAHVHSHALNQSPGWWEGMVGPGKALDTNRYFVICINNLGSCHGSTGPLSLNPETQQPYLMDFPQVCFDDIVASQQLLLKALAIDKLFAVVSYSMGAMISLTWAQRHPDWIEHLIIGSTCYRAHPTNQAWRAIQRDIITQDPNWQTDSLNTLSGYRLARKIAMLSYRTATEFDQRFLGKTHEASLENYLNYNADKFIQHTHAHSYLCMLDAMDRFDLVDGWPNRKTCFQQIKASTLLISVSSDVLYPPAQQDMLHLALQEANRPVEYIRHESLVGHDAFIVDKTAMTVYINSFLR